MKVLLAIPHVFSPKQGSLYSSQTEAKRNLKQEALFLATIGNLNRHRKQHWIHASLGKEQEVVNRELNTEIGVQMSIQLFSPPKDNLAKTLPADPDLSIIDPGIEDYTKIPITASKLLEQADNYDLIGYLEDDILISDPEFLPKYFILTIQRSKICFLPHRCEHISGRVTSFFLATPMVVAQVFSGTQVKPSVFLGLLEIAVSISN